MIQYRRAGQGDREAILQLIRRSDSTARSPETWDGNRMQAVMAHDGDKLIGVLPVEPRRFALGGGRSLDLVWISAAHVEPEYRSQGIGSALDAHLRRAFRDEAEAVFVYRGDERSAAYRWYKQKLGYHELLPTLSYKKECPNPQPSMAAPVCWERPEELPGEALLACFSKNTAAFGGFPERRASFWADTFRYHYYREYYRYRLVALPDAGGGIAAYALLARTDMRDGVPRLEVLELIAPVSGSRRDELLAAIWEQARRDQVGEVRIQLSPQDAHFAWIREQGFTNRYRSNVMGALFDPWS
ncbi:MAG: GNAT family N-acetyltransferase, partial [Magnetococcales bacterium]|nr:GNAT family N-acetyltransferase [Magnetococcales bacterium]